MRESAARVVKIQTMNMAEAVAQRRGQQARTSGRADQREALELQLDGSRRRSLTDHDIDLIVLHRRIEHLFDDMVQAMNFIDKKDIAFFEIGKQRRQIAGRVRPPARKSP